MEFGFVPRTGMCLPNKDVKNCEHLNKNVWYPEPVETVDVEKVYKKVENEDEIDIMEAIKKTNNQEQSVEDYVNQLLRSPDLDNDFDDDYPDQLDDAQGSNGLMDFGMQYVRHENTIGDTIDPIIRDQDTKDPGAIEVNGDTVIDLVVDSPKDQGFDVSPVRDDLKFSDNTGKFFIFFLLVLSNAIYIGSK